VKNEEIESHGFVLTPGRYVGTAKIEEENAPFEERFLELKGRLAGQQRTASQLDATIARCLASVMTNG
jgi:type I restriction enzyme M protein